MVPRMQRQAQVDGGGIERVNRGIQIDAQRLLRVQGLAMAIKCCAKSA